jgi:glutathione S-transferase
MLRFYYGSGSPYSWRVQLSLEEKGIPYEPVLLSFDKREHKSPEHLARHPHGKVPALTDGDLVLYESSAIVEYLEDAHPSPPLLPAGAAARAHCRIEEIEAVEYFGRAFFDVARLVFFTPAAERDQAAVDAAAAVARGHLGRLEARAAARGGTFVLGPEPTRADLAWIPFVEIAGRARIDLDPATMPWLVAWRDRMRARPAYRKSYPPHWRQT